MKAEMNWKGVRYQVDLSLPLDIGLPLRPGLENPNCFYAPPFEASPVRAGDFVGDTREGGVVNFFNVRLNPHGNGTHTECVGHLTPERVSINASLQNFHYFARVVSILPTRMPNGDRVILQEQLDDWKKEDIPPAFIIRTIPNDRFKRAANYSGSNPPYLEEAAVKWLVDLGVQHLLLDLPSVDREEDGGTLLAHKAFWKYPEQPRMEATITELIYVPEAIKDGLYLLNLQIAAFDLDATPSKPVLYELSTIEK